MKLILIALSVLALTQLRAQDSLSLKINSREFKNCDTISFEWSGHSIGKAYKLGTLYLWIEDLETNQRWKYRYPIVNGVAEGAIEISKAIDTGTYAFTFMGSDVFLNLKGQVKNMRFKTSMNFKTGQMDTIITYEKPGKVGEDIKYTLVSNKGILMNDVLKVGPNGEYNLPPIIFGDTANLIFDIGKNKNRYWVQLQTPLDSLITPFYTKTVFVNVRGEVADPQIVDTLAYVFDLVDPYSNYKTLQEVSLKGLTRAQRFEKDNVSAMFRRGIDVKTFDGIDNDEIARSPDVFTFLQSKVAGLRVVYNGSSRSLSWYNEPVQIYIDEMPWSGLTTNTISTSEIAMIKVHPPPSMLSAFNPGGAVAIYSKRGSYDVLSKRRFAFEVAGYTQGEHEWK